MITISTTSPDKKGNMKRIVRGIVAFVSVIITTLLIASGAQAATADQSFVSNYVGSDRSNYLKDPNNGLTADQKAKYVTYLTVNEQMNSAAQAWADHLAAVDNRSLSPDPNVYRPEGSTIGISTAAYHSPNDRQAALDESLGKNGSVYIDPSWTTIGTGVAVAKSGAIYIVMDFAHVNPPAVVVAPPPVQAPPVAVPVPVAVQPDPVPAAPVEQAPAQADPAPAPAPAAPAQPAPAPVATEAPKPVVTPSPTPTATTTPSAMESASPSATASVSTNNGSMDAERTSENTAAALAKQPKQVIGFSAFGLLLLSGGGLSLTNRRRKAQAIT